MNRFSWRVILGIGLLLFGGLVLLQNLNVLHIDGDYWGIYFVGALFVIGGLAFLSVLLNNRQVWWPIIPGFTLLGIGAVTLLSPILPAIAGKIGGALVLGSIALAFWGVYAIDRKNWWAIIPAGVLTSVVAITLIPSSQGFDVAGVLFLGMALTFALLGVLPIAGKRMSWPWIPAGVLAIMGVFISMSATRWMNFIWPGALILLGIFLTVRAFNKSK